MGARIVGVAVNRLSHWWPLRNCPIVDDRTGILRFHYLLLFYMRSIPTKTGWLLLLAGWVGWACQSGDPNVGQNIITPNQLEIQFIDTVSVFTSTVAATDSFATSGDTALFVGHWRDALAGATDASSFGTPVYAGNNGLADLTDADITYDSLVFELPYSYVYGDTTQPVTLQTYRLTAPLRNDRIYYSNNTVPYQTTPFAQRTFYPQARTGRDAGLVRIRLTDELGRQLYSKLRNRSIENADQFQAFLPGLAFTSTSAANLFLAFSANRSSIALYYHQNDANRTKLVLRFPFAGPRFNRVLNNFAGTPLQPLRSRLDRVPSTATKGMTFLASTPALRTRIDIPGLTALLSNPAYAGINRAELTIQPVFKTQRSYLFGPIPFSGKPRDQSRFLFGQLPAALRLYETNNYNEFINGGAEIALANYGYNTTALDLQDSYTFDLTQYVLRILRRQQTYQPFLLSLPPSSGITTMERITIGDRTNVTDPIKLRLFVTYNK